MQFNSIEFLFSLFPVFLLLYYCIRTELRGIVLVIGSLIFYTLASGGNYWWVAILALACVFAYYSGKALRRSGSGVALAAYLGVLAAVLVFFKLFAGGKYLPAGMSFYLFQIAAYLIDVYRRRITPEKSLLSLAEQIVMFPKLLSGPLMDARELKIQSRSCNMSAENFRDGLQKLILGLGLKVIFANRLGGLWSQIQNMNYDGISAAFAWMALVTYAMKLYFDFYGYSLMAEGIGQMLGFRLPRNFDHPYASKTVSEFYRRWHISLGAWFREYLYIPLGGNRKGMVRTILNLAVVWLFTGLWHGVGGNYVLWAGFLFLLIVNERLWLGKLMNKSKVVCHVYVVFVILLSWVPFAIGDAGQMWVFLKSLFGQAQNVLNPMDFMVWGQNYLGLMIGGLLLATPLPAKLWEKIRHTTLADIALVGLFWVVVYYISTAAQDPFMYFQY